MHGPPTQESRRWRTLVVAGIAATLLLVLVAVGEGHLKAFAAHALSARSGRPVHINGDFEVHLFSGHPSVRAHEVVIDNPPWLPRGAMVTAELVTVLLRWHWGVPVLGIERLEIVGANLHLLRDSHGRANWQLHPDGPGAGPPLLHSLSMPEAHVQLHDALRHLEFEGEVSAGEEKGAAGLTPLRIDLAGQLNGRHVTFRISGEPLGLVRRDQVYHFEVEGRSGTARLHGQGSVDRPFDLRRMQADLNVRGEDMRDMYYLAGLKLPHSGAFELSARMLRTGSKFEYKDLQARTGESDLTGTVRVELVHGREHVEAQLTSQRLRLADLGPRADPEEPEPPPPRKLEIPATPWRVEGLRDTDAVVSFHAHKVVLGRLSLADATGKMALERGKLTLADLKAELAGGSLSGEAQLDASRTVPRGSLDLALTGVQLDQLKKDAAALGGLSGLLSARAQLKGSGASARAMAATAEGTLTAVIPQGRVRAALPEAASLELAGALGLLTKSQKTTAVRCAVASFDAHEGILSARTVVFDTDKARVTMTGDAHVDSQELDFTLRGHPKSAALALHSAVVVQGTLEHPQFRLAAPKAGEPGPTAAPVAPVLAFVDPGLAHNADCQGLLGDAEGSAPPAT